MKVISVIAAAGCLSVRLLAQDLTITSFDRDGALAWSSSVPNATYRVEWAGALTQEWARCASLTVLDAIRSTDTVVMVKVPTFFRVLAFTNAPAFTDGLYRYTGYDAVGELLVTGWLSLARTNETELSGSWMLGYAGGFKTNDARTAIGPQIGVGRLRGLLSGGRVGLDLNPGAADKNVGLQGTPTLAGWQGTWEWITFVGRRTNGTFIAERQRPAD